MMRRAVTDRREGPRPRRHAPRRATVVGAGAFGTAISMLLVRAGVRTTLLCRTGEHAEAILATGENERHLPGVPLPDELTVRVLGNQDEQFRRADVIFLGVPSAGLPAALEELRRQGTPRRSGIVSLAKGLVPPDGTPPSVALARALGRRSVGCVGGPAHAQEMVESGAGLVVASHSDRLARAVSELFRRSGVVCEPSADPVGVELAGCAKNAAALASGATVPQGLNAAGMAVADLFGEVLALAEWHGASPRTFLGRAGVGDLIATALAGSSRNRSAGELLAEGVPASEIPDRLGHAAEALDTVPLLATACERARLEAPVLTALASLIDGTMPLDDWIARVRVSRPVERPLRSRASAWFQRARRRLRRRPTIATRPA
jgi:glycerol-3-phosphate dehydrogenase (NAD(P)+)